MAFRQALVFGDCPSRVSTAPALRSLRPSDAAECARLHAQAFTPAWTVQDFADQIGRADRVLTGVTLREPALAGFAISRFVAGEADLLTIVVDRAARHGGLGAKLLAHHLSALTAVRVATVFLEVSTTNDPALGLYDRMGFVRVGTRKNYYESGSRGREDAVVLRRDL